MKQLSWLLWAVPLLLSGANAADATTDATSTSAATKKVPSTADFSSTQISSGDALTYLSQLAKNNSDSVTAGTTSAKMRRGVCSPANVRIRREWRTLSKNDRKAYINAVKCLRTKPSLLAPGVAPGSVSLYDDFVVIHLMQTLTIHLTATFLTWHRYFTWTYEEHLRNDCGYTGTVPYWEWGLDVNNPAASPVFDGSDTSLGGNGQFFSHPGMILTEPFNSSALIPLPPGTGGGCVQTGPFANFTVHIGPVALAKYGTTDVDSVPDPLNDHPRCLKRDLNAGIAKRYTSFYNTTTLILQNTDVEHFQAIMQADPRYIHGELGVHGGGHFTIGGDPGSDPFISPGDPGFFLHHSQIDRVYWIWQMLDFSHRQNIFGTGTFLNVPPSANVQLTDTIDITPLAPVVKVGDLLSTFGGPFCYIYV